MMLEKLKIIMINPQTNTAHMWPKIISDTTLHIFIAVSNFTRSETENYYN